MVDEKGRLFGKLSVIDLGILLCVIMIALGSYMKFFTLEQTNVTIQAAPVRYTIVAEPVRDWAMRNIREGDAMFVQGVYVGTIEGISYEPHEVVVQSDGALWRAPVPERFMIILDVVGTATISDGRIMVSRTVPMAIGNSSTEFTTRYAEFHALVREIHVYDE